MHRSRGPDSRHPSRDPRDPETTSDRACPVCGEYELAIDTPPQIAVMGFQPCAEILGMGELSAPPGIVCLACETHWRDLAAFEAGEPDELEEAPAELRPEGDRP